jgi:putative endonuclease
MFCVYVLYSESFGKIYIGFTTDLEARFRSHNEVGHKGWTIKFRPWILFHQERFERKEEAIKRERELKSAKGREWIWDQIRRK